MAGRRQLPIKHDAPFGAFGAELRALRGRGALSIRTLALEANCTLTMISQAEAGTRLPGPNLMRKIAEACGEDPFGWMQRRADYQRTGVMPTGPIPRNPSPQLMPMPGFQAPASVLRRQAAAVRTWAGEPPLDALCSAPACCAEPVGRSTVSDFFNLQSTSIPERHTVKHIITACIAQHDRLAAPQDPHASTAFVAAWVQAWSIATAREAERPGESPRHRMKPGASSSSRYLPAIRLSQEKEPALATLVSLFREAVRAHALPASDLAATTRYSKSSVSRFLSGARVPSAGFIRAFHEQIRLQVDVNYLYELRDRARLEAQGRRPLVLVEDRPQRVFDRPRPRAMIEIRLLGTVRAFHVGRPLPLGGSRQTVILAVLLLHRGQAVPKQRLIECVWLGDPPATAEDSLAAYLSRLRRALEPAGEGIRLLSNRHGFRAEVDPHLVQVDAHYFDRLLQDAVRARDSYENEIAAATLRTALEVWRGGEIALADLESDWLREQADGLAGRRLEAIEMLAGLYMNADRAPQAVTLLRGVAPAHPERETMTVLHIRALTAIGETVQAAQAAARAAEALVEHGQDPGPELRQAQASALTRRTGTLPTLHGRL